MTNRCSSSTSLNQPLLNSDQTLRRTIDEWPREIYDISAVIIAIRSELDKATSEPKFMASSSNTVILMECLADLLVVLFSSFSNLTEMKDNRYAANRQPGKALYFYLRLRRPNVFELIREHNLFTDVQDQVLLLVEFDHELMEKRKTTGQDTGQSETIALLVNNTHSIPVSHCLLSMLLIADVIWEC